MFKSFGLACMIHEIKALEHMSAQHKCLLALQKNILQYCVFAKTIVSINSAWKMSGNYFILCVLCFKIQVKI